MKRPILLFLVAMNVIWAASYPATKVLMAQAPAFLVTSIRYLIAAAPLLLAAFLRGGLRMPRGDLARCAAMGVATYTLSPWLMYLGVGMSRAADAAVLIATEPLLASLGAYLFLRERIGRWMVLGLLLAFGGVVLLSEGFDPGSRVRPLGTLLIVISVVFEASYSVIGREVLARHDPLRVAAVTLGTGCAANATAVTALGWWPLAARLSPVDWLLLAGFLAVVCTLVGYTAWFYALRSVPVAGVVVTIFIQPVAGLVVSWIWVHEVPTVSQIAGTVVILAAVTLALTRAETEGG